LVKGNENEENRTWINGFREVLTITAISKQNLENFGITSDFSGVVVWESLKSVPQFTDTVIWQNNQYIFTISDPKYLLSDFQVFDVTG
jgi:glycerol kinase